MEKKLGRTFRKIAVVGPESTGKSMMSQRLARELDTWYVPEYSRYYCKNLDNQYTLQDELNIFYGQIALEEGVEDVFGGKVLFCDTTVLTVKVWSDYLFGFTPPEVLAEIQSRHYDFYLLMDIDLPWEDDPLRDFPDQREYFREVWIQELEHLKAYYTMIEGTMEERFQNGIGAVKKYLELQS